MELQELAGRMSTLSPKKQKIVAAIADGLDDDALAAECGLLRSSVGTAVSTIYRNLGLDRSLGNKRRRELLRDAWRLFKNPPEVPKLSAPEEPVVRESPPDELVELNSSTPPLADPLPDEAQPVASVTGSTHALSTSMVLQNPDTITGLRVLSADASSFERDCLDLVLRGYHPEILNEYQSMEDLHLSIVRVVFIKRDPTIVCSS